MNIKTEYHNMNLYTQILLRLNQPGPILLIATERRLGKTGEYEYQDIQIYYGTYVR